MSEEKNTTKRKSRLSRRTFVIVILSVCAVALVTEIVLLIHAFSKKKAGEVSAKQTEEKNYDGYIWLLVEETDSRLGTCKYEYDDFGRCIRVEFNGFYYADPERPFCEITDVKYYYEDGEPMTVVTCPDPQFWNLRCVKGYYNSSGVLTYYARYNRTYSEETGEYTGELTLIDEAAFDEYGRVILDRFYRDGTVYNEMIYEYDQYGHTILEKEVWNNGKQIDRVMYRGTCDSLGRVIEILDRNDEVCKRIEYTDEGYAESYFHNREDEPYGVTWYNADGEKIREENKGEVVFLREDTGNGYRTIEKESNDIWTKEYDQRGLLIARDLACYDESGAQEIINSNRMTYDEDGRLIQEERILKDGTKQLIQVKYSFDSYGNLIAEEWSGADEQGDKTYRYVPVKLSDEQLSECAKFCQEKGIFNRLTERVIYR